VLIFRVGDIDMALRLSFSMSLLANCKKKFILEETKRDSSNSFLHFFDESIACTHVPGKLIWKTNSLSIIKTVYIFRFTDESPRELQKEFILEETKRDSSDFISTAMSPGLPTSPR
jgi:hypothetical protein